MLDAITIGNSGLSAYASGLKTISNNVANLNSPGFKTTNLQFSDLFYSNSDSTGSLDHGAGASQYGNGVTYAASSINFLQGDIKTTTGDLDLAIQGRGFLILTKPDGQVSYIRTGQFTVNQDGAIVDSATGLGLTVFSTQGGLSPASVLGMKASPPKASSKVAFSGNLSSTGTTHSIPGVKVFDAAGVQHTLTITFSIVSPSTGPVQWDVAVTNEAGVNLKTGQIEFAVSGVTPATSQLIVDLPTAGGTTSPVTLDFSSSDVTGFSSGTTSTLSALPADGYALGTLSGVVVGDNGQLSAQYSNGQTSTLGDIVLADFDSLQNLQQIGGGQFLYHGSNAPIYGRSGDPGFGAVKSKSVEGSNVNLSEQFSELILVQRGFQASSQIISTANEMLQQVFGLGNQR